jgi:colanic acid biosynthesis glycosyl transferase WcaI
MKISVWGINYWPELIGIAVYNRELCEFLCSGGFQVDMVTAFAYYPFWKKQPADKNKLYRTDRIGKVNVHRCWHYVPRKPSPLLRILHEGSFAVTSTIKQLMLPTPDLYLVVSPPLVLGLAAWIVSKIKRAPFHFHIQDLQPDAALGLNMLRDGRSARVLYALERLAYAKALSISCISDQMRAAVVAKGVPPSKVSEFPNWVELPDLASLPARGTWKTQRGIAPNMQIASYCGNLGVKQGLELVLKAAKLMQDKVPVLFVIAGDGAQRSAVEQFKHQHKLDNVILESVLSESEHSALLVDSDVCLITQSPGSGAAFLPSKLLKTLAFQRAVLTNAEHNSALACAIEEGQFGYSIANQDAQAYALALEALLADESARKRLGEAGRAYISRFHREIVLPEFMRFLQQLPIKVK